VALRSAAARLAEQFTGIFGAETIERFLHTSFDQRGLALAKAMVWPAYLVYEAFAALHRRDGNGN
jgi:hypothetical protein